MPEENYPIESTLQMLWSDLIEPVLGALGYMEPPVCRGDLPHITWCLTGALSFLPVHAAGDYTKQGCSLFDYAISSFTPSVSALLAPLGSPEEYSGILAIGQAHTPGLAPLPGTVTELEKIIAQADTASLTRLEGAQATTEATLAALDSRSWVHFACHASQNVASPTESAFHLHNGSLDLATIARKQLKHADLAFLSACQTATGDADLPQEAVHLAAGMIVAGYRRVIATLWSINDEDAPLVAEKFYAYMLDKEIANEGKAAKALHHAVGCLRDKVGVRSFERWAPYIHIGQ
ncbi:hypothetical protein FRC12_009076 [Ceratobasidium sp. 428]|nr:hypothetical protein FRC12_009076 [Ceratobasidium sp. 428]